MSRDGTGRRHLWIWSAVASGVFALAFALVFAPLLREDLAVVVPTRYPADVEPRSPLHPLGLVAAVDQRFTTWVVARNARTLLERPGRLWDAEQCYPSEKALALGESALTLGLLGVPAYWLTGDPIVTFNLVLMLLPLISALAMYLLIRSVYSPRK